MAKPGEGIVKAYLESRGLTVKKVPESAIKTVDFAVYEKSDLSFNLEEKSLEMVTPAWKSVDPVYNALAKHIHDAAKQFRSSDPKYKVPHVLAFTSMDWARNINHLLATLTGYIITTSGKLRWVKRIEKMQNDLQWIDLYLWFNENRLTGHIWEENNLDYQKKLAELLKLDHYDGQGNNYC